MSWRSAASRARDRHVVGADVTFAALLLRNIAVKPLRSALTALAVAIGVAAGITIGVVTHSLRESAVQILSLGHADFSVSQEGVSDVLSSAIDEGELARIRALDGVASVIGVLIAPVDLDADNPFFLRIGIDPSGLAEFGVRVVDGVPFSATAPDEIMLGYRAAVNLGRSVGDEMAIGDNTYRVVGLFATDQEFGDAASMLPLVTLQAQERKPGDVTLAFVRVDAGYDADAVRADLEQEIPQLVTVRTVEEFGRVDRNLELLGAADTAATMITLAFGVIIVTNTMLLTFTERIREFGVLRAIGWSRRRVMAAVMGETMLISIAGAAVGVALSYFGVEVLRRLDTFRGLLEPDYTFAVFGRALLTAVGIGAFGAVYPALRAALLVPLEALRRE
jgi:putative ABC transport system permease protein